MPRTAAKKNLSFLSSIRVMHILIGLLVIAAFFIGTLYTKIQYLEKGGIVPQAGTGTQEQNVGAPSPSGPPPKVNIGVGHLPVKGNKNAKVTIVEFADFRCPFCQRLHQDTILPLIKEYVDTGKAKLAYRHYAFLGPASTLAANAAECANEQKLFWEMHDYLFENQPPESDTSMFTVENMTQVAGTLGMDTELFRSCLDSGTYDEAVSKDMSEGQKVGVSGTPTLFINGIRIVGAQPYLSIKSVIDGELK